LLQTGMSALRVSTHTRQSITPTHESPSQSSSAPQ
jgi:hypothetical protein